MMNKIKKLFNIKIDFMSFFFVISIVPTVLNTNIIAAIISFFLVSLFFFKITMLSQVYKIKRKIPLKVNYNSLPIRKNDFLICLFLMILYVLMLCIPQLSIIEKVTYYSAIIVHTDFNNIRLTSSIIIWSAITLIFIKYVRELKLKYSLLSPQEIDASRVKVINFLEALNSMKEFKNVKEVYYDYNRKELYFKISNLKLFFDKTYINGEEFPTYQFLSSMKIVEKDITELDEHDLLFIEMNLI